MKDLDQLESWINFLTRVRACSLVTMGEALGCPCPRGRLAASVIASFACRCLILGTVEARLRKIS